MLICCFLLPGCSSLSVKDYMVMNEALKEESLQAQRTATNLHGEVQALQQQLGMARAGQARLQGELRDAERRLLEAQRATEQQREELARATNEREQLSLTGRQLQAQLSELDRLRQQAADADREHKRMRVLQASIKKLTKEVATLNTAVRKTLVPSEPSATPSSADQSADTVSPEKFAPAQIVVKAGDTLYSIARTYTVAVADLKFLNRLHSNRILVGQVLLIPEP